MSIYVRRRLFLAALSCWALALCLLALSFAMPPVYNGLWGIEVLLTLAGLVMFFLSWPPDGADPR